MTSMKRILIALLFSILLVCTVSCKKQNDYNPQFTLAEGYVLKGDRISATVIGEGTLRVRDFLISSDAITIFKGSSTDQFVQGLDAQIPLTFGKNHMVIRFSDGTHEKEYDFEINCIAIQSFSIVIKNPEKTYHIGEKFDKSTIAVLAIAEDGTEFEVHQYTPEYEFSSMGKNTVGIELDGWYESFSVTVTEEYRPILDANGAADGVSYHINGTNAVLLNAQTMEGFFAIPSSVIVNGMEIPVTGIADHAFSSSWITGLLIPDSVKTIGNEAFSECLALEWIEMPSEMTNIGHRAFYRCEALNSIEIPEGITVLNPEVFQGCKSLSNVTLPFSLQTISDRVFKNCTELSEIHLPDSLQKIGDEAFHSCKNLSTIVVENLSILGNRAFAYCDELRYFCIGTVETIGTGIFNESKKVTVYAPQASTILQRSAAEGVKTVAVQEDEYYIVTLPIEFAIEQDYPYHETLIIHLSQGRIEALNDYTVDYPRDACGYLEATITEGDFSHTFTVFISYTEEVALDTDSRGVVYHIDSVTGKATLVQAPKLVKKSKVYQPETEGLFIVPTTLFREGKMYVVVFVEENAFEQSLNVENVFIPVLTKES